MKKFFIGFIMLLIGHVSLFAPDQEKAPEFNTEYIEEIRNISAPEEFKWYIWYHCNRLGIDPDLVCAIIKHESGWNSKAVNWNINKTSDLGLGQLNSRYMSWYKRNFFDGNPRAFDYFNPEHNINVVINIVEWLQDNTGSDLELILAYNRGLNGARKFKGMEKSQKYVQKVLVNYVISC